MGKLELVIESDNVSIYSPKYDGETQTEFEKFMSDNGELENPQLKKDFDAIIAAIKKIIDDCGARENLFRPEGNNIKAILTLTMIHPIHLRACATPSIRGLRAAC